MRAAVCAAAYVAEGRRGSSTDMVMFSSALAKALPAMRAACSLSLPSLPAARGHALAQPLLGYPSHDALGQNRKGFALQW